MMRGLAHWISRVFISGVLLVAGFLFGGCTSFNHAWTEAARHPAAAGDLEGRWQGSWVSDANGHHGELRCIVAKKDDGTYSARFHAKYGKALSFGYTVPLTAQRTGNVFAFKGGANLGWYAGGHYEYDGTVDGTNFFSTYRCKYDHGTFQMTRPPE